MRLPDLTGRSVVVWGAGREGRSAVRALRRVGARSVTVVDDAPADGVALPEPAVLNAADAVVVSPGVSRYDPRLEPVRAAGRLTTGSALWMVDHHDHAIAVTGSKGKSTTSALVHHVLQSLGVPTVFGGNIGVPLLDLGPAELYVLELSSYQCAELQDSPRIVGLTSLFPEHLNWHGSAEQYFADKLNIVAHDPDAVVYNGLDQRLADLVPGLAGASVLVPVGGPDGFHVTAADVRFADQPIIARADLPVRGGHNALNVCVALAVVAQAGVDVAGRADEVAAALGSFAALPYRLSVIARHGGVEFVDDSLSTAPQAAVAALQAFPDGPVALIAGGQDRGVDYAPLREHVGSDRRPYVVIGIPASGPRIVAELAGLPHVRTATADDLPDAVRRARAALPDGGTVLLSPAAPSYGVYRDHIARSEAFRAAVAAQIPPGRATP